MDYRFYTLSPLNLYRPQTKLLKGNVFTPVCQLLCSRGRCIPPCNGQGGVSASWSGKCTYPWEDTPGQTPHGQMLTWVDNPLDRHPLGRHPLRQTPPPPTPGRSLNRAVHIVLECILVVSKYNVIM